mmetsp:Transcript_15359/g.36163  ORF Transcript_15359/g.36163 Transcript_15359/m.36163 type:complete len:476 (+) Transcript_15359:659-2086(+)
MTMLRAPTTATQGSPTGRPAGQTTKRPGAATTSRRAVRTSPGLGKNPTTTLTAMTAPTIRSPSGPRSSRAGAAIISARVAQVTRPSPTPALATTGKAGSRRSGPGAATTTTSPATPSTARHQSRQRQGPPQPPPHPLPRPGLPRPLPPLCPLPRLGPLEPPPNPFPRLSMSPSRRAPGRRRRRSGVVSTTRRAAPSTARRMPTSGPAGRATSRSGAATTRASPARSSIAKQAKRRAPSRHGPCPRSPGAARTITLPATPTTVALRRWASGPCPSALTAASRRRRAVQAPRRPCPSTALHSSPSGKRSGIRQRRTGAAQLTRAAARRFMCRNPSPAAWVRATAGRRCGPTSTGPTAAPTSTWPARSSTVTSSATTSTTTGAKRSRTGAATSSLLVARRPPHHRSMTATRTWRLPGTRTRGTFAARLRGWAASSEAPGHLRAPKDPRPWSPRRKLSRRGRPTASAISTAPCQPLRMR